LFDVCMVRERLSKASVLAERFQIERHLATGGMGEIYLALNTTTKQRVALKTIRLEGINATTARSFFRREADLLRRIQHDGIVGYHAFFDETPDYDAFIAMEYVDGVSLRERLQQKPLSFAEVTALRKRLALSLQACHDAGVVHGDLAPDNVLLPNKKCAKAKLIDFGIAQGAFDTASTVYEGFAFKVDFASPEHFSKNLSERSDIYSLGLLLVAALTGRPLPMGKTITEMVLSRQNIPSLVGVDSRLRPLIEQMLHPDPMQRIPSMRIVAEWELQSERRPSGLIRKVAVSSAAAVGIAASVIFIAPRMAPLMDGNWLDLEASAHAMLDGLKQRGRQGLNDIPVPVSLPVAVAVPVPSPVPETMVSIKEEEKSQPVEEVSTPLTEHVAATAQHWLEGLGNEIQASCMRAGDQACDFLKKAKNTLDAPNASQEASVETPALPPETISEEQRIAALAPLPQMPETPPPLREPMRAPSDAPPTNIRSPSTSAPAKRKQAEKQREKRTVAAPIRSAEAAPPVAELQPAPAAAPPRAQPMLGVGM
jgi:tRNA A-37 threonylcarbamoyl transferase component Bud32